MHFVVKVDTSASLGKITHKVFTVKHEKYFSVVLQFLREEAVEGIKISVKSVFECYCRQLSCKLARYRLLYNRQQSYEHLSAQ